MGCDYVENEWSDQYNQMNQMNAMKRKSVGTININYKMNEQMNE